ncbi:hypothetical protein R1080702_033 [Cyanophage S-RIM32]|uniref:Uncharacterized protein n=1 Tax=Cyanophage S-RIM32 TaxID=1278479 RepID=A0A127KLS6_9CAUD|nr:virion structural protein [Cyanophage S-RIM32]AMO43042.1 hypothetical protein R1080702_033 [Cyanophage S-RIM32]
MPSNTYEVGTHTLDLPASAYNISLYVRGGRGGRGGTDAAAQGGSGGLTTGQNFTVNQNYQARRFTLYVGNNGGNGVNSAPNAAGGSGGSGLRTGGRGGNAGDPPFSGGGGGGGGASGVAIDGVLVICMGGSGGGGGASNNRGGGNGGAPSTLAGSATTVTPTNGGGGGDPGGTDGGGGGGGGAGDNGGGGGGGGTDNSGGGGGGGRGGSTYRSDYVTAGSSDSNVSTADGSIVVSWENAPPPTVTISLDKSSIIAGETAQLSWTVEGFVDTISVTGVSNPGASGTVNVSPNSSTTYTITASGAGGTSTESVTLTVYQPVVTDLTASPNPIVRGSSSTLSWTVSGDASSASIDQGIGPVLFNSSTDVSPTSSTEYTLSASGNGGSDTDSVTITVYQQVELTVSFPGTYDYGIDRSMSVTTRYASSEVKIDLTYNYFGGTNDTDTITLNTNSSSESGSATTQTVTPAIPWNGFGPETIDILVTATGLGGTKTALQTETVNIDRLPDNINIPERLEQIPSADPVVSPDEDTVLSDPIEITDIDVPVEIRASRPIQVRFDDDDPNLESSWESLRSLL